MDYEQDYSKLTSPDNQWYTMRIRRANPLPPTEEESAAAISVTLDNEDFD